MSNSVVPVSAERNQEAIFLHNTIMANGAMAAQALAEMCRNLKRMRDEKLYIDLGYEDFGEYCDKAVGIGARQGYTYIQSYERLGAKVIEEHSSLGITKLSLLVQMNPVDRVELLENGELENMSTKEIKELVAKSTQQSEQLSLITEERDDLREEKESLSDENEVLHKQVQQLKAENKDLKSRPVEISPEPSMEHIEAIREEAEGRIRKELTEQFEEDKKKALAAEKEKYTKKIEKAKAEGAKAANENKAKEIADAVKKAKEEAAAETEELKKNLEVFKNETLKLEKQLKASDSSVQKVLIYLQAFQDNLNKTLSEINTLDGEQKEKMKSAVVSALKQILEQIGG